MERRKPMKLKQAARRKMSPRVNKKHRVKRDGQNRDGAVRRNHKSIRTATKMTKGTPGTVRKNGAPVRSRRVPAFRHPKTELEAAIQRFVDLYDFAPIAYVSFGRSGRIGEANLTATELLGEPRDRLIGRPFAFYVADLDQFMRHLLYCRTSERRVKTDEQLKTEHPESRRKIYEKLFRDHRWEGELVHTCRNGKRLTVFSRWVLDRNPQGNTASILETNNDITRRKQVELALQESKKLLEE